MINEKIIIYILITIVIISGTMFGITTVKNVQNKQDVVSLNKFLLDMDNSIMKTKDNYGKVLIEPIKLPNEVIEICFIDLKSTDTNLSEIEKHQVILDSVQSGVDKNMFLVYSDRIDPYFNPFLRLDGNKTKCLSFDKGTVIEFKFTGTGNSSTISLA